MTETLEPTPGAPAGTGLARAAPPPSPIRLIAYGPDQYEERELADVVELGSYLGRWPVTWVDVEGPVDPETIRRLGETFRLHSLAQEDVVDLGQRPKVEEYEDHLFLVARVPVAAPSPGIDTAQISMFLGANYLLSFQELRGDGFEPVRQRLRHTGARIRALGADHLAYALLDAAIDSYYPVLERYGERVEALEDALVARMQAELVPAIHALRRDLLTLRRAIWPQREMISLLSREEAPFVTEHTRIYLRDCYDHAVELLELVETYREIATELVEMYLSSISARTNEIMSVLTVVATIFIPLGFIASVYGMNFDRGASPWNMPELGWRFGYPVALGLMAGIAVALLVYFYRKGWIGRGSGRAP